ncbi:MAG: hypothetical protein IKC36_01630 [Clostridia bacterium]|nr:hypothetical protein [Clostridia bacterium]
MKKQLTIASLLLALTLSLVAFYGFAVEAKAEALNVVTASDMISDKDNLRPAFNHPGAERLTVTGDTISPWSNGFFYYTAEVDGAEFSIKFTSGTDIAFCLRATGEGCMWGTGVGYFLYVSGNNIELYEVTDTSNWNNKKIAGTAIDANIFDGNAHNIKYVIDEANDKFVVAIDKQSFDVPYPDEFLAKTGTNFKIVRVNSAANYTVSDPVTEAPVEPDPTPDPTPDTTAGIAITAETMLANPDKLLPVFNWGGVERLNITNGQISAWADGNFFYKDLVDSVSFPFSVAKGSTQTMLFIALHAAGPGNVPWNCTGYYAFVQGNVASLYRIDSTLTNDTWQSGKVGESVTLKSNIFDGGLHNLAFAVNGKTLTFTVGEETVTGTFTADALPVENTEVAMSSNSGGVYYVGEPLVVEQAYTGKYTNVEDLLKTGAIRPDYNYDSVANKFFCEVKDGFVLSNKSMMSFNAELTAVDFDIVVTSGSSMFFAIRALNFGNIWDMTGGYIAWVNGTSLRFYDASQHWEDSPVVIKNVANIYDGKQHNIKMYAFDDSKGNVQVGFAIDNGEFTTLIDTTSPTTFDKHTEFYMHDVNQPTVTYKVTAPEGTVHAYGDPVVVAPTCTEAGYTATICADCKKKVVSDETAATGHSYNAEVTAPTCLDKGYTTYTCACGDSYVADEVAATGHSYTETVTAPTCEDKGYTTHTCACGDSYEDTYVPATGHSFEAGEVVAPTCTEAGYTVYECANCDATEHRDEVEATGHSFVESSRTEAAPGVEGEIVYDCENCDETQTEVIPAFPANAVCYGSIGIDLGLISVALGSVAMLFVKRNKKD